MCLLCSLLAVVISFHNVITIKHKLQGTILPKKQVPGETLPLRLQQLYSFLQAHSLKVKNAAIGCDATKHLHSHH